jgi:hypothetical protein
MPTFCRHNRFVERCPICSRDLPGADAASGGSAAATGTRTRRPQSTSATKRTASGLRVRREGRALEDGYSSALMPGLRASEDARRLADEIAFAAGRLSALAVAPPGLYGEAATSEDPERATWICFLVAYLSPVEGEDPFAGVRLALERLPSLDSLDGPDSDAALDGVELGPRSSHNPGRGVRTLKAYRDWLVRSGDGTQAVAFAGDESWSPERRFERLFERLALPGLSRAARFELLVVLGRLGLFDLRPDSLHLGGGRGEAADEPTILAAKRVFGIGDPLLLERRAGTLAEAISAPLEALDPALASWGDGERASLDVPADTLDPAVLERARTVFGL